MFNISDIPILIRILIFPIIWFAIGNILLLFCKIIYVGDTLERYSQGDTDRAWYYRAVFMILWPFAFPYEFCAVLNSQLEYRKTRWRLKRKHKESELELQLKSNQILSVQRDAELNAAKQELEKFLQNG